MLAVERHADPPDARSRRGCRTRARAREACRGSARRRAARAPGSSAACGRRSRRSRRAAGSRARAGGTPSRPAWPSRCGGRARTRARGATPGMSCRPNQNATPTNGSAARQRYAARRKRAWRRGDTPSGFVPAFSPTLHDRARRLRVPAHLGHPDRLGAVAVVGHHRVHLAVGRERVAADAAALVAVVVVRPVDQARGVGVHADRVEAALRAVRVERGEEVHVVADHAAGDDGVARLDRLDRRVGGAQQRRVGGRVGAAGPELGAVGLVPQLPRVGARHALGDLAHERAPNVAGVGRRRDAAAPARRPGRRAVDDDEHLDAARLQRGDARRSSLRSGAGCSAPGDGSMSCHSAHMRTQSAPELRRGLRGAASSGRASR